MSLYELLETMPTFHFLIVIFNTLFWLALLIQVDKSIAESLDQRTLERLHKHFGYNSFTATPEWWANTIYPVVRKSRDVRLLGDKLNLYRNLIDDKIYTRARSGEKWIPLTTEHPSYHYVSLLAKIIYGVPYPEKEKHQ